ncbi:hypothetical protein CR513_21708, partial [Mucuna pruriens]
MRLPIDSHSSIEGERLPSNLYHLKRDVGELPRYLPQGHPMWVATNKGDRTLDKFHNRSHLPELSCIQS